MKKELKLNLRLMCVTALFAAVIFIFTGYVHIPSHTGYTHIGDGFIWLAAAMLPTPYAAFAGACGAMLADCLTGYALWAPATVIIKAVSVFFFTYKAKNIICVRNMLSLLPTTAICAGGYYLYEALITGNFIAPLAGIPGYLTQSVLSALLFVMLGFGLDRAHFKRTALVGGKE